MTHEPDKAESTSGQTLMEKLREAYDDPHGDIMWRAALARALGIARQHEAEIGCPYENQKQAYQAGLADAKHHQSRALEECRKREAERWQPIETAPYDKFVLVWWRPIDDNKYAETVTIAQRCFVERPHADEGQGAYEEGCWWSNGRYYAPRHIACWMPLPPPPFRPDANRGVS